MVGDGFRRGLQGLECCSWSLSVTVAVTVTREGHVFLLKFIAWYLDVCLAHQGSGEIPCWKCHAKLPGSKEKALHASKASYWQACTGIAQVYSTMVSLRTVTISEDRCTGNLSVSWHKCADWRTSYWQLDSGLVLLQTRAQRSFSGVKAADVWCWVDFFTHQSIQAIVICGSFSEICSACLLKLSGCFRSKKAVLAYICCTRNELHCFKAQTEFRASTRLNTLATQASSSAATA